MKAVRRTLLAILWGFAGAAAGFVSVLVYAEASGAAPANPHSGEAFERLGRAIIGAGVGGLSGLIAGAVLPSAFRRPPGGADTPGSDQRSPLSRD